MRCLGAIQINVKQSQHCDCYSSDIAVESATQSTQLMSLCTITDGLTVHAHMPPQLASAVTCWMPEVGNAEPHTCKTDKVGMEE